MAHFQSYCGAPPIPTTLWVRWNLDPVLIAVLVATLILVLYRARQAVRVKRQLFVVGWALGAAALISPLCALSVSLFAARIAQHMILTTAVAPLIALAFPAPRSGLGRSSAAAAAAFAVMLWVWHAPGPYAATFGSDIVYWAMHLSVFGSALWFWRATLRASSERLGTTTAATLFTGLQMALLGAVITFARSPLYEPHWLSTIRWGLTPLQDQQLGGAIMWLPAGVIIAAAILAPLARVLREPAVRSARA
jgi:putative membrane protein